MGPTAEISETYRKGGSMRFFAFVLTLQTLSSNYCDGFSSYSAATTYSQHDFSGLSNLSTSLKDANVNKQEE